MENGGAIITFPDKGKRNLTAEQVSKYGGIDGVRAETLRAQNSVIDSNIAQQNVRIRERGGETYAEYISRVWDETVTRTQQEATDTAIAERIVRADDAVRSETAAGETAMTRQLFREKIATEFGLPDDMYLLS